MNYPIRINKYLRDSGLASRREADVLVGSGQVFVNGKRAENGQMIAEHDKVTLKGKQKEYTYIAYYKPRGLATQDLAGKQSVVSDWRKRGLYPVGRLDKESEGLLLLTNDGRFAREVLSQKEKYEKEYVVSVRERLGNNVPRIFESGMETKSLGKLLPAKANLVGKNSIRVVLREGKRHQIRVMLQELNYTVTLLRRVRIGSIKLGNLKPGEVKEITVTL